MDDLSVGNPLWIFAIFAVISIAGAGVQYALSQRRRRLLATLASRIGFEFYNSAPGGTADRFEGFVPFGKGSNRRCTNYLNARRGEIKWELFDYHYATGSGDDRTRHDVGIVVAHVPLVLPRTRLRPEGVLDRLAKAAGFDDINFESEEFNRRYHVTCSDRKRAYDLIHPRMIEYLQSQPSRDWQFAGDVILLHREGVYAPGGMVDEMARIEELVALIPQYVRQDLNAMR